MSTILSKDERIKNLEEACLRIMYLQQEIELLIRPKKTDSKNHLKIKLRYAYNKLNFTRKISKEALRTKIR